MNTFELKAYLISRIDCYEELRKSDVTDYHRGMHDGIISEIRSILEKIRENS